MRDGAENKITLVLIRHGETQANKEYRYLGKTDESLSESGRKMLMSYKEQNNYPDVTHLFTSPMKRCTETAKILYPTLCPVIIPEWEEMDFGKFEYKNYDELKGDKMYQMWLDSGGTLDFPGGESRKDFILRCEKGLIRMCDGLPHVLGQTERVGAIVHGGTIMSLLSKYAGKDYFDYQVANGCGYMCKLNTHGQNILIREITKI